MVSQDHDLSQRRQCTLLQLSRSTLYYRPKGESVESKADQKTIRGIVFRRTRFMEIIDNQFLETPWYGSRQMARHMERQGHKCGRRHAESVPLARRVRRLMRLMRVRRENSPPDCFLTLLTADLPGTQHQQEAPGAQDLSLPAERAGNHPAQPGLVRRYHVRLENSAPSCFLALLTLDGARVPVSGGHHGLAQPQGVRWAYAAPPGPRSHLTLAVVEHARGGLLCRGLERGAGRIRPARGLQHRSRGAVHQRDWIDELKEVKVQISMDGKGRWIDNRMIERLSRSLKYECVTLRTFETGSQARDGIGKWLTYYNAERPHSTHGILTPDEVHASKTETMRMAA
jgi:putative transposase